MSFKFTPISTYDPNASEENDREEYHKWHENEQITRMPINELRENLVFVYGDVSLANCDYVFVCNICIKHLLNESLVEAHLKFCKRKENHAPTDAFFRQMFECPHCPKEFALRRTLADHMKIKHPNAIKAIEDENLMENVIVPGNEVETNSNISIENQIAIENFIATGSEVVISNENAAENEVVVKNEDMLEIEVMAENGGPVIEVMAKISDVVINEVMIENKYVAGNELAAGTSRARVPREKRYKCPHCPKTYVWEKVMARHIIQIHTVMPVKKVKPEPISEPNEVIVCRICFMHFQQHTDFRCHMILYHPMDPSTEIIEKKFKLTEGKPYVCSICYKVFSRKAALTRHQLTAHTVNDPDASDDEDVPPPKKIRKRKSSYRATKKITMSN